MRIYSRSLSAEEVNNLYVHEKGNYVLGGRETAGLVSGNPGGYFSMTEAVSGMSTVVVLPDLTEGKPIAGFSVEMDLRMGNGTGDAQADGFSINFARADLEVSSRMDPMLQDLEGGSAHPNNAAVNGQPETGTQTGLSILIATHAGETLPDDTDVEGLIVRLDNRTLIKVPLSRMAMDQLQTGPLGGGKEEPNAERGDATILGWEPLKVTLNSLGQLSVNYKGEELLPAGYETRFYPSPGRVVLMGRNGGLNEIKHFDNLKLSLEYLEEVEPDNNNEVLVTHEAGTGYIEYGAEAFEHNNPNQRVTVGGDQVDGNTPGTYRVTYDAVNAYGNQSATLTRVVEVVDGVAPVITLNGERTIHLDLNATFTDPGATATDNYDTSVTVTPLSNVNTSKVGNYQVVYQASDDAGNEAVPQVRQVFVRDQSGDRLEITLGTPDAKLSGEEVAVPVTVKGFNEISSLQFSLEWDPTKIRLIKEVENGTYGPKMTNIHSQIGGVTTNPITPGKLVIVWFSINSDGETISDTEKLFDLHFNLVGDPGETSAISLVNDPVPYRVGTGSRIPIHETAVNGTVSIANLRYFGGEVRYLGLEDHLVSDVNVYVSQQDGGSFDVTDAEGRYEVMVNPDQVTGVKADAEGFYVQDGVDVLDIAKVGQHIALSTPFSLPQEYVAADVNRDYIVDALDLSAMLQVALGDKKFFTNRPTTNLFELVEGSFTFYEAIEDAQARGGQLAAIYSQQQNDVIKTLLNGSDKASSAWIGLEGKVETHQVIIADDFDWSTEFIAIDPSPIKLEVGTEVVFLGGRITLAEQAEVGATTLRGTIYGHILKNQISEPIEILVPGSSSIDADQWAFNTGVSAPTGTGSWAHVYQTFTAGKSGHLAEVIVGSNGWNDVTGYKIDLHAGHSTTDQSLNAVYHGELIATSNIVNGSPINDNGYPLISFIFDSKPSLIAGDQYTLVVTANGSTQGIVANGNKSSYPGDDLFVIPGYGWTAYADLKFRTIIENDPVTLSESITAKSGGFMGGDGFGLNVAPIQTYLRTGHTLFFNNAKFTLTQDAQAGANSLHGALDGSIYSNESTSTEVEVWSWQDSSDVSLFFQGDHLGDPRYDDKFAVIDETGNWVGRASDSVNGYVLQVGNSIIHTQPTNQTVTETGTAVFKVGARGNGVITYQWQGNGQNIPGATSDTFVIQTAPTYAAGEYRVIVTADGISEASNIVTLEVEPPSSFDVLIADIRQRRNHFGPFMPILLYACREDQLAHEYRHGNISYGAFTYVFSQLTRDHQRKQKKGNKKYSFEKVISDSNKNLKDLGFSQEPQIDGPEAKKSNQVFGVRSR